ncbi:hypothetical protein P8605_43050 [Streptomyces sp. T-3]|nr:hypothetical protein [Streptomyces sp. T-3]
MSEPSSRPPYQDVEAIQHEHPSMSPADQDDETARHPRYQSVTTPTDLEEFILDAGDGVSSGSGDGPADLV